MFETKDTAGLPYFWANEGEHLWSQVGIILQYAWFQVTYKIKADEDLDITETIFLSQVSQLVEMTMRENVSIEFVDLVSPGYMNGSERWKMEPLREIWLCASDEWPNQQEHVFLLESGSRYKGIGAASSENDFQEDQLIFRTCPLTT